MVITCRCKNRFFLQQQQTQRKDTMSQSKEMREQRCKLVADARAIMDSTETLDAEQRQQVDTMLNDSDLLKKDIDRIEAIDAQERALKDSAGKSVELALAEPQEEVRSGVESEEYRDAFMKYLRKGNSKMSSAEQRVMVEGTNTAGGFTAPMFAFGQATLQDMIIETMDSAQNFTQYATSMQVGGQITVPVQNAVGTAAWTTENAAYNDSETTFTQLVFSPYKATRILTVSQELLSDAYVNMEGFLAGMFGRSFATLLNTAFISGASASTTSPSGVMNDCDNGKTTATTGVIVWSEITDLFYSLKESYRANGTWLFNSSTASYLRNLNTGTGGAYIWQPSALVGEADTLMGRPVAINDACDDYDAGVGARPVLFGDLSYYWITYQNGMNFQRLDELYAASGNVGLKADVRVDGQLTSSEAVKAITSS